MNEQGFSTHDLLVQLKDENQVQRERAFRILYTRYMSPLFYYARQQGLADNEANSASHDTLLRVYQKRNYYDEGRSCNGNGWIWTIHKRIVVDWLRKAHRSLPVERISESLLQAETESPERCAEIPEQRAAIQRAWNRLNEEEQQELQRKRRPGPMPRLRRDAIMKFQQALSEEEKQ